MLLNRQARKLLALLAALLLFAAACGGDDSEDAADTGTEDTADEGGGEDEGDGEEGAEPEPGPGFDGETIRLGVLTPQTGSAAIIGTPLTAGNQVWFDKVNAEGGIAGKYKIELDIKDSQYLDAPTAQQYDAIKEDVVMFAQVLGTPPTNAILSKLSRDNIVASPASLDLEWVREEQLLPLGTPYQFQMINGASYYVENGGSADDTFCVFAQNDAYGDSGIEGLEFAGGELGFELATTTRYARGDQDFTAQTQALQDGDCDVVFAIATPAEFAGMLKKAADNGFAPRWIGMSPVWINVMPALVGEDKVPYIEENLWIMAEGPAWGDESVPGMVQMLADIEEFKPDQAPDYYFGFGYNQARVVTALLEKAVEMGDLSRDGIKAAMSEIGDVSFDGLSGDYSYGPPEDREPPRSNTLFEVDVAAPNALAAVEVNFTSEAAEAFELD